MSSKALASGGIQRLDRGNAADQILRDLQNRILSGALPRGSKLPTEKQLAEGYGVSTPTVREAIRSLVAMRLVEVRHGSGAYVTANADELIAVSLMSLIQLERICIADVLGVLGVLLTLAAERAAANATKSDIESMQASLDGIDHAAGGDEIAAGLTRFLHALAYASHNPLLTVLCRFLASLQIGLAKAGTENSVKSWRKTVDQLKSHRQRLVDAIRDRDTEAARRCADEYYSTSLKIIGNQPNAHTAWTADLDFFEFWNTLPNREEKGKA